MGEARFGKGLEKLISSCRAICFGTVFLCITLICILIIISQSSRIIGALSAMLAVTAFAGALWDSVTGVICLCKLHLRFKIASALMILQICSFILGFVLCISPTYLPRILNYPDFAAEAVLSMTAFCFIGSGFAAIVGTGAIGRRWTLSLWLIIVITAILTAANFFYSKFFRDSTFMPAADAVLCLTLAIIILCFLLSVRKQDRQKPRQLFDSFNFFI